MAVAFIFPGQGSQTVGMGKALAEAFPSSRAVFAEVDEALSQNLSKIIWEGPEADLTLTENTQPALMAVSIAAVRALKEELGISVPSVAKFVAGHSLGEYSALVAAETFTLSDAAKLLRVRGRAMQSATPIGTGAMAALLGLSYADAVAIAAEAAQGNVCQAANDNADGQVVVSGHAGAVERAVDLAKGKGAKRAVMLSVSAPFHCALMKPAEDAMSEALANVSMRAASVPLISNVKAGPVSDPAEIRKLLVDQVTGTVRWRESMAAMVAEGIDTFCELGAGKVLTGLIKRNAPAAKGFAAGTPDELNAAAAQIKQG